MAEAAAAADIARRATERLRLPPHSVEAEQSLLGGLMLDQRAWDQIADVITVDDLYRADHRLIFMAVADLVERNQPPDAVTVSAAYSPATRSLMGRPERKGGSSGRPLTLMKPLMA